MTYCLEPLYYISTDNVAEGIFTIGQGLTQSFEALVAMHFVVGLLEAGLITGSIYLLSAYYPRYELQWRLSLLHVGNATSNAFGGLLAYAVANVDSSNAWKVWRWIFVIEGVITVAVTLACWPFINDWPATAKWLNAGERAYLERRIRQDGIIGRMDVLNKASAIRCLTGWKIYIRHVISFRLL